MSWLFFWRRKRTPGESRVGSRVNDSNKPRRTFALASLFRRNNITGYKIYKQEELTPEIDPYAQVNNSNKVLNLPAGADFMSAGDSSQYSYNNPPPVAPRKVRKKRTVFNSFAQSFSRFRSNRPTQTGPRTGQVKDRIRRLQNGNTTNNKRVRKDPLRFNTGGGHENANQYAHSKPIDHTRKNYSGVPLPKQPHWQIRNKPASQNQQKLTQNEAPRTNYSGVPLPKQPSWQIKAERPQQPTQLNTNSKQFGSTVSEKQSRYEENNQNRNLPTIFKNDPYSRIKPMNSPAKKQTWQQSSQSGKNNSAVTFGKKSSGNNFNSGFQSFASSNTQNSYESREYGSTPPEGQNNQTNINKPWQKSNYTSKDNKGTVSNTMHSGGNQFKNSPWSKPQTPRTEVRKPWQPPSPQPSQQKWKRNTDISNQSTKRKTDNTFNRNYDKPNQTFGQPPMPTRRIVKNVPAKKVESPGEIVMQNREKNLRASIKGLKGLASFWNEVGENNRKKQELNPFSSHFNGKREVATGNVLGSKSDERARKAQEWTNKEIDRVVQVIKDYGKYDPNSRSTMITFGELFLIYEKISDTLVFMLLKARKRNRIAFDGGEMLLQGRDDHVQIFVRE